MNPDHSGQLPPRQQPDIQDLTPEDLENLFKEKTEAQAQKADRAVYWKVDESLWTSCRLF